MDVIVQISIEGIGGLESKKGKNLIDILSGQVDQPSFFIRTSGTLGKNSVRFSTGVKRKRHQIIWQQTFLRKASGLRVDWDDQFVKDKSQIAISKPRSGVVNDGKSKIVFELVRIDKFESDFVIAIAEINPIRVNMCNAGSGDLDSVSRLFDQVYPLTLQGTLVGDVGTHDLSLRASFSCLPTVIPIIYSLPNDEDVVVSFDVVIKEAKLLPIKILKAATSFICMVGKNRTNSVSSSEDALDPQWDEIVKVTLPLRRSLSSQNISAPFMDIKLFDHRGSGIPDLIIGEGTLSIWEFFAGVSKDQNIRVPLLRCGCEGNPTSSDMRGHVVIHIMEPELKRESASLFHNLYHEMIVQILNAQYEQSRTTLASNGSHSKIGQTSAAKTENNLSSLLYGSRHLKCTVICCMEDCDDEKASLENEIFVKVQLLMAMQDVGAEICTIYYDQNLHSDPYKVRIMIQQIFESEICMFVLGLNPGDPVDQIAFSNICESSLDDRVDAWLKQHLVQLEEREESVIEILAHAAEFAFREDPHVTEKVIMFQRQVNISDQKLYDGSDHTGAHTPFVEMPNMTTCNAATVDKIARRIASFGASCFTHNDPCSFSASVSQQLVISIQKSRLNIFRIHSLLNSSIFELQFMRSTVVKKSSCRFVSETHAFKSVTSSLQSCSSGRIAAPAFVTCEDSLSSKHLYCALCCYMRSNDFKNIGSDVASHRSCTSEGDLKPCFFYDFSTSSGSKSPVAFFRALLQGLRAIMASEPCNLHDDIVFESGSVSSELSALVKPMLKAAVEEYLSFSFLFSGIECLDPDSFQIVLSIFPKGIIPGLWICFLLGTRDAMYCSKMQSVFFAALPCSSMCAMAGSQSEVDAAVTLIQDIQITHSSISIVLQKFRNHPNFCSMAYFLSAICLAFSSCCGADTTQMFIQLAQSTAVSASFSEIICDILLSMHTVPNGPRVFQYLMLCARSRFGLQPSDLIAISNTPSSVHLVCVEILRCLGGCIGCFCIVPFSDVYIAIDKVIESSADPRNVIRLCDSTLLKHFASMPVKWKIIENLLFISEMAGEFGAVCQLLRQYRAQQYILSNEFCSQDFRSFWLFFCRHPAGESISHRSRILKYLSDVKAASKEFCNSIVISAKFCSLISLYETADSILGSFKELYQSDIDDNVAKLKSDDWSHLCLVFALQGRLSLAWGRLDAAESYLKEALAAHGCVMDSDQVASSTSQMFDASRAVSGRLLSEIASVLLVKGKNREALSFADKGSAFIDGIEPSRRNGLVSPSCVLDIMMCAMEARLVNGLKAGAFSIMENALKVCNIEYGKFHPRSISTYERLCSLSSMNLDNTGVLAMYQRILMDLNVQLTWGFDVTGKLTTIILLISDILIASHQPIEAVALCEQALKYRIQRYGSEPNLQVARCLEKLAACRMQAQDPQKATKDLKGALKIRQLLTESKKDQDYFMCVLQLSGALKAAGFRSEARQHLKEWVEHLKAELGDNHEFVHTALDIIHSRMND